MPSKAGPKADPLVSLFTAEWELPDAEAFQALRRGDCPPHLQQRAVEWLIRAAGTHDLSFRPGVDGDRLTAFAEGKRFVGMQVIKLINLNLDEIEKAKKNG